MFHLKSFILHHVMRNICLKINGNKYRHIERPGCDSQWISYVSDEWITCKTKKDAHVRYEKHCFMYHFFCGNLYIDFNLSKEIIYRIEYMYRKYQNDYEGWQITCVELPYIEYYWPPVGVGEVIFVDIEF